MAVAGLQLAAIIHLMIAHIQAAIGSDQRNEVSAHDTAACVLRRDDVFLLLVVENGVVGHFAVGGGVGGTEGFVVVVDFVHCNRFFCLPGFPRGGWPNFWR